MAWLMNALGTKKPQAPPTIEADDNEIKAAFKSSQNRIRELELKINQVDARINALRREALNRKQKGDLNGCKFKLKQVVAQTTYRNNLQVQLNNTEFLNSKVETTVDLAQQAEHERKMQQALEAAKRKVNPDSITDLRMNMEDTFAELDEASNILNTELNTGISDIDVEDELAKLDELDGTLNQGIVAPSYQQQQPQYIPQQQVPIVPDTFVNDMPTVPTNRVRPNATTTTMNAPSTGRVAVPVGASNGDDDMMAMLNGLENA